MKKFVIVVLVILIAVIAAIYILIPNIITFNKSIYVQVSRDGITRKLQNEKNWTTWWPGKTINDSSFLYNNTSYSIIEKSIGSLFISIKNEDTRAVTSLNILSKNKDTAQLIWIGSIPTSYNPIKRIQIYFDSKKIPTDIDELLKKIKTHFSKVENVYGYDIEWKSVVDSTLVFTYNTLKAYPSVEFTYQLIDKLKKYITEHGAKETGFPMLNITKNDSAYLVKVAIPVNKILPSSNGIAFRQMPSGGNILVVDVKGGPSSIQNAFHQVQNYIMDYSETVPAIPYQSLITDRSKEKDTSQWITKIYYPVF